MSSLRGKIALVTGASKGIGAGIAERFGAESATVVATYKSSREGADRTVSAIEASGGQAWALQGDFSRPEDVARVYSEVETRCGTLDVLVNNAGVAGFGALESVTVEEFRRQFDLNVLGLLLSIRAAAALMKKGGSIINIGSTAGAMPGPFSSIYAATKGAVTTLSISLSKELGPRNIRVNVVNPGLVRTEGLESTGFMSGERYSLAIKSTPLGRAGEPSDIAAVAAFLASDDACWITGQSITAAGGLTI